MRAFLVSDNHDSLVGMRIAGIPGVLAHGADETIRAVRTALEQDDLGILVLTERAASEVPDVVRELRQSGELPIVLEIPDRHGTKRSPDFLTRYVQEAIGVKVE
ncbi:MAG: V-type ATP synthase subunit F [Thermovirgaceae bacterium]|nr:V-type ATP synthase subunit F [Thermovirgaceae bacterium]